MMRIPFGSLAVATLLLLAPTAAAQSPVFSGVAFGDYYYIFSSPDEEVEDLNGFTLRRLHFAADFDLPEAFDARVQFEANAGNIGSTGMDLFIKDLWLRWRSEGGHAVRLGIIPTVHWDESSEAVWAYRSLEATIMDALGIATSRDFGVRVDGPLLRENRLTYALMFANNNGLRPESDKGKRVYGTLIARPISRLVLSASADYAGYTDARESGLTVHGFAGVVTDRFTVGVEPFWNRIEFDGPAENTHTGISFFAHATLAERWRVVGRVDLSELDTPLGDVSQTLGILALSFEPFRAIRLMPNVYVRKLEGADEAEVRGRFTFEYRL